MWLVHREKTAPFVMGEHTPAPATTAPAILGNQRGIALVMALVLGLVGMLMITAILYMVGTGTWQGGSKKRYQTALNASYGGMDFFVREIIQRGLSGESLSALGGDYSGGNGVLTMTPGDVGNFATKLTTVGVANWTVGYPVTPPDATLTFTFTSPTPDMTVNSTIMATHLGNSTLSSRNLIGGLGVTATPKGGTGGGYIPFLFLTETQGQSAVSSKEKANLSAIYIY